MSYRLILLILCLLSGCLVPAQPTTQDPRLPPATIVAPAVGSYVSDLRPVVRLASISGAQNYLIELSPEPTFSDRNAVSYIYSDEGRQHAPMQGVLQQLRLLGLDHKYMRQADNPPSPEQWRVPFNLTAMIGSPYGYRVAPCRDWLAMLSARIVEKRSDPLQAINEFVSFSIINEGSGSGYYDAYEVISRDMGVCGNTAELVSALAASLGYRSHLISLKGRDQGHVVAASQRSDGSWVLLDGLYNIMASGYVDTLVQRVRTDPSFLNIAAFAGVDVPYRYFFDAFDVAYQTQTTPTGVRFSRPGTTPGGITFEDLANDCASEVLDAIKDARRRVISNVFFVRASYFKDGRWAPWAYSYFVFRPTLEAGEALQDNAEAVWRSGLVLPQQFGGRSISTSFGTPVSAPTAQGYTPSHAFSADGRAWVSARIDHPYIGMDFGADRSEAVNAIRIRWVTPEAAPGQIEIQYSDDLVRWTKTTDAAIDYPDGEWNFKVSYISLGDHGAHRAWRIRSLDLDSAMAVEYVDFLSK